MLKKLFTCGAALILGMGVALAWETDAMNTQIDQTNFVVNEGCSGTLIDVEQRLILTAKHCVSQQYKTEKVEDIAEDGTVTEREVRIAIPGTVSQITFAGSNAVSTVEYRTKVLRSDRGTDLALLQIKAETIPNKVSAPIACENVVRGDEVLIVGNPAGLYSSVTKGIVSSVQRSYEIAPSLNGSLSHEEPLIQVDGGVVGGNSGGAVYNSEGELVGVPVAAYRFWEKLGFMAPISSVLEFLNKDFPKTEYSMKQAKKKMAEGKVYSFGLVSHCDLGDEQKVEASTPTYPGYYYDY